MQKWQIWTSKICLFLFLIPSFAFAADFSNVGIIPSNIWYSKFPFYADEPVKIYTALFNNSGYVLRGTLAFYDGTALLGKKSFNLPSSENLQEIYLPWQTNPGSHSISIKVENAEASKDGKTFEAITLANTVTGEQKITVNVDPAKDEIAQLKQQIANLSIAQTAKSLEGKISEAVTAVKTADVKTGIGALDSAVNIGVTKIADIAQDSATEAKARIDTVGRSTKLPPPQTGTTTQVSGKSIASKNVASVPQFATSGALSIFWNYIQYFFFSLVALLFWSKWTFYITCVLILIICILKLRRR